MAYTLVMNNRIPVTMTACFQPRHWFNVRLRFSRVLITRLCDVADIVELERLRRMMISLRSPAQR